MSKISCPCSVLTRNQLKKQPEKFRLERDQVYFFDQVSLSND